ncbi:MAG TPA: hypothetical protein VGS23_02610 [Thermoplasmata archaeon]|nr:hypothetical protein [Thermoplasmata archaeon]
MAADRCRWLRHPGFSTLLESRPLVMTIEMGREKRSDVWKGVVAGVVAPDIRAVRHVGRTILRDRLAGPGG